MSKRIIIIVGIVLILIAVAIISGGRSRVEAPSAGVQEPAALNVGRAVAVHVTLARAARRDAADELGARADAPQAKEALNAADYLAARREMGFESAAVVRAVVTRVNQVKVRLVADLV